MEYILVGKIVNTHALKGEVRIISDFEYKLQVFIPQNKLYIGEGKEEVIIVNYRKHKNFDMCLFKGYDSISQVLKFKGSKVYINREDLIIGEDQYLDEDLINLQGYYEEKLIGVINDIISNNGYKLFLIDGKYIPYNKEFIKEVNLSDKKIIFKNLEGIL